MLLGNTVDKHVKKIHVDNYSSTALIEMQHGINIRCCWIQLTLLTFLTNLQWDEMTAGYLLYNNYTKTRLSYKADHSLMRAFSYAWPLPVTGQRRNSYHSIRHIQNMPHANFMALCYIEAELWPIEVKFTLREYAFSTVLHTWPWPRPDDLHKRTWPEDVKINFLRRVFRKLSYCSLRLPSSHVTKLLVTPFDQP